MDTTIFVAIVTAISTLVGALSPTIVALIQSRKEKQNHNGILLPRNVILHRPKTQIHWLTILFFALLGGAIGYGGAKLASPTSHPVNIPTATPIIQSASETPEPTFTNPAPFETLTETPAPTNTSIPTATNYSTETPTITPTLCSNVNKSESFQASTFRHVSLCSGELLVGTAVRFAIRAYDCNTIDVKENIPYTVFLLRGPLEVDVEIYNGGWDYWANIYDDNFAESLLIPKRNEVALHPNYPTVGHVECIIPPFK